MNDAVEQHSPGANVLLISIDTLRQDHLGCYGYERPTSPHIDAVAARRTETARLAKRIELINKNDTGSLLFGLLEQISDAAGTYAHKHLYELGTRNGKEWHASFA